MSHWNFWIAHTTNSQHNTEHAYQAGCHSWRRFLFFSVYQSSDSSSVNIQYAVSHTSTVLGPISPATEHDSWILSKLFLKTAPYDTELTSTYRLITLLQIMPIPLLLASRCPLAWLGRNFSRCLNQTAPSQYQEIVPWLQITILSFHLYLHLRNGCAREQQKCVQAKQVPHPGKL